jgi:branched-chain amino acid transport system permease protein
LTELFSLLISGISLGFVYALVALGFVVIFRATRVVNFAHASVLWLGAYVIARTHHALGFLGAVLVGIAAAAVMAALIEIVLIRRIRLADLDTLAILTIGVNILLGTELSREIGSNTYSLGDPWGEGVTHIGSITVPDSRVAAGVVAIILLVALGAALRYLDWGVSMRASAEDHEAAALMGVRLGRAAAGAWLLAGALAAVAGLFFTTFPTPGVDNNTGLFVLSAFPAAIIGGLDSIAGAVVGGLAIGIVVSLTAGYQNHLSFLGGGFSGVAPYVVMVLVLLIRPAGLFGRSQASRV